MRRIGFIAITALGLVALVAPVVEARHDTGGNSHHSAKTPTFVAKTNTAAQGDGLRIVAKVKHADRSATFSATAVVHFASGDVAVTLTRHGKSFVAGGVAQVASDETPGSVPVEVTVNYNGTDEQVETEGTVEVNDEDDGDDSGPGDTCDPAVTPNCDDDQGGDQDS